MRSTAAMVLILFLGLALSAGSRAGRLPAQNAAAPDLSGVWELVEDGGSKKSYGDRHFPQLTLEIRHQGSELKIIRKRIRDSRNRKINGTLDVREFIYHTDGRGDTNVGRFNLWFRAPKVKSVTRLDKDKILTEFEEQVVVGMGGGLIGPDNLPFRLSRFKEEWSLSEAGNKLVLNARGFDSSSDKIITNGSGDYGQTSSRGSNTSKFVFRRI